MFAIRARRKVATERDFLDAVDKVVRQGTKFSSTFVMFIHYFCLFPTLITCLQTTVPSIQLIIYVFYAHQYIYHLVF